MTEDAARARDAAIELVHGDIAAAEARAHAVPDPWYRAQALAWVTRHAPDADVVRVARAGLEAAADCRDPYRQAGSAAWVVRALFERGYRQEALEMLEIAMLGVPRIQPASSRSEALFLLLQAAFASSEEIRRSLVFALAELHDSDPHWRIERNFHDALRLLLAVDAEFVDKLARGGDERQAERRARALAAGPREPRRFFW